MVEKHCDSKTNRYYFLWHKIYDKFCSLKDKILHEILDDLYQKIDQTYTGRFNVYQFTQSNLKKHPVKAVKNALQGIFDKMAMDR